MANLERTYNIPLRKEFQKAPPYKRAKKAITAVREFLVKHMKSSDINLGTHLNQEIWSRGIKNPPHHIKVSVTKDEKGKVMAELVGAPKPAPKAENKAKPSSDAKELASALAGELKQPEAVITEEPKVAKPRKKAEPKAEGEEAPKKVAKPKKPKAENA